MPRKPTSIGSDREGVECRARAVKHLYNPVGKGTTDPDFTMKFDFFLRNI